MEQETEILQCDCCGKIIEDNAVVTDAFLTPMFGYVFCSDYCLENYIESK